MSWILVLQLFLLLLAVFCIAGVLMSVNNDGKMTTAFINKNGRYPTKKEQNIE